MTCLHTDSGDTHWIIYRISDNQPVPAAQRTQRVQTSHQSLDEQRDLKLKLIYIRKAFTMNTGRHRHYKSRVHAPQRVLDLHKCLYSSNNTFMLFTHVLLGNANVFSGSYRPQAECSSSFVPLMQLWYQLTLREDVKEALCRLLLFDLHIVHCYYFYYFTSFTAFNHEHDYML